MKKKFLITVPTLSGGGMERSALSFAHSLSRMGFVVKIFTVSSNSVYFDIPKEIEVVSGKKRVEDRWLAPLSLFRLRRFCKRYKPDIVLSFSGRMSSYIILALLGLKIPILPFHRGNPSNVYGIINNWLNKQLFPLCPALVVQTTKAKEIFANKFNNKQIIVVPNPVRSLNISEFTPKKNIILNVSRLVPGKGTETLIRIFAKINPPNWYLEIVGDGELRVYLQEIVLKLGMVNKIKFVGFQKDVDQYLSKASIFAFSSESEGFPNALLEAMCSGLACISFDCPTGPSDMIVDGKNGFLIEMNDEEQYINKLIALMQSEELRAAFAREAIKLREKHNQERVMRSFLVDIESLDI